MERDLVGKTAHGDQQKRKNCGNGKWEGKEKDASPEEGWTVPMVLP